MEINGLIDSRNTELWNDLIKVHEIEICKEKRDCYLAYSKNKKTIIYVPYDKLESASFTHELLHIYLRTKDVFIGDGLSNSINQSEILSKIFSDELIEHISNCLDHIKMLPEFIMLGFDQNEFLTDYYVNKLTNEEIAKIKTNFVAKKLFGKTYNAKTVDFYVGKYFAAKCCPNKTFDYDRQLKELSKIDTDLFQILENFMTEWVKFDYNDTDPISGSYNTLLYDFIDNLEKWTYGKRII